MLLAALAAAAPCVGQHRARARAGRRDIAALDYAGVARHARARRALLRAREPRAVLRKQGAERRSRAQSRESTTGSAITLRSFPRGRSASARCPPTTSSCSSSWRMRCFAAAAGLGGDDARGAVARLDAGIATQLAVLKNSARNEDAAFNYEYLLRLRAARCRRSRTLALGCRRAARRRRTGSRAVRRSKATRRTSRSTFRSKPRSSRIRTRAQQAGKATERERRADATGRGGVQAWHGLPSPRYLPLLVVPAALLAAWVRLVRQRVEVRRFAHARVGCRLRERFALAGELLFWLCVLRAVLASHSRARAPQARIAVDQRRRGLVICWMHRRRCTCATCFPTAGSAAQRFLRTLADTLSWKGDRVALALFAHRTAPQLRLSEGPECAVLLPRSLGERSPFSLETDTTWDTNIEEGMHWGLRLVATDEELFGTEPQRQGVRRDLGRPGVERRRRGARSTLARERRIPVHVVGVGTASGGMIPEPEPQDGVSAAADSARCSIARLCADRARRRRRVLRDRPRVRSRPRVRRDRASASAAAGSSAWKARAEVVYWHFLLAAAVLLALGMLLLTRGIELVWQAGRPPRALVSVTSGGESMGLGRGSISNKRSSMKRNHCRCVSVAWGP